MMRWLLRLLLPEADRRAVENDLLELHAYRRRTDGDRAAARWLRRQRAAYPWRLLAARLRSAASGGTGAAAGFWRDAAYGARALARAPAAVATIVFTVGIAIGVTTALATLVRTAVVNPLPYARSDSLVWIYTDNPPFHFRFSVVDYRALDADHPAFTAVAGYQTAEVTIGAADWSERVNAKSVTGSYFPLLGQAAIVGRLFDREDDRRRDRVAVLTAEYWERRFGGDSSVLGRSILLDGEPHTVVGVLQRDVGPLERGVAVFTAERWPVPTRKGPFFTMAIGRLRDDVSRAEAVATLRATNARLFPIWKASYQDEKATWGIEALKSRAIGDVGRTLWLVLAAVACVLLISCANAMNLLIARALGRRRELAIRRALGASTGHVARQIVAETSVLSAGAALVGCVTSALVTAALRVYGGPYIPRVDELRLSADDVAILAGLTAASAALILAGSVGPALSASAAPAARALGGGGRTTTDGPNARRVRRALVALEFALAMPLMAAAGLLAVSLARLGQVDVGLDVDRLYTAEVALFGQRYADDAQRQEFWVRTVERLSALPGVEAAAVSDSRPPDDAGQQNNFDLEDHPTPPGQNQPLSTWVGVSPAFYRAAGLRLERGRPLDDRSLANDEVVVDRAWALRFFGTLDVVGRRLRSGGCTTCPWTTIVGVVSTAKWVGLDAPDRGTVYFPFVNLSVGYVVLRTTMDAASLGSEVRQAIRDLDPALAVTDVATGRQLVSDSLAAPRYLALLAGVVAVSALTLSLIGIYGVMAHFVEHHTRDIGIRLALGGEPAALRRMIVRQGLGVAGAGLGLGLLAALGSTRVIAARLFGIGAEAHLITVAMPLVLLSLAAAACLIPGRRAARMDPAAILRE